MDSAMRDLERLHEHGRGEGKGAPLGLLVLAGLATAALVLALAVRIDVSSADERGIDPLDRALAPAATPPATADPASEPPVEVDPVALTFPETLQVDDRPEVAAALAAAAAELRHPDPLPLEPPASGLPAAVAPLEDRLPAALPAALAAGSGGAIARAAPHDPMLLQALPEATVGERAPEGHDGEYTVQVISYESPEGAHAFAAGLRARGHRAFVMRAEVPGRGTVYRVRIGPFETMAAAQRYRRQFEETERMNTIVVRRR